MPPSKPAPVAPRNVGQKPKHIIRRVVVLCTGCLLLVMIIDMASAISNQETAPTYNNLRNPTEVLIAGSTTPQSTTATTSNPLGTRYVAGNENYYLKSYNGWAPDQVCFVMGNACRPVQGISPDLNEMAIYQDTANIYLNAYNDPSFGAKEPFMSIIYLLKGDIAVPLGSPGSFTKNNLPEMYQTSEGVYFIQRLRSAQNTDQDELRLVKIDGMNFVTVLDLTGSSTSVAFSSNDTGEAYILLGLNNLYEIQGSTAIPVEGLTFISESLGAFDYVGGSWYFVENKYDLNNDALIYKITGTDAALIQGLNGYNKFTLFSNGTSTYAVGTRIVSGFCGDDPCEISNMFSLPDGNQALKLLGPAQNPQ